MVLMVKIALDRLESKSADRLQIFSLFPLISPIRCVESAWLESVASVFLVQEPRDPQVAVEGVAAARAVQPLAKAPTGIRGFDGISAGGLPRGRPTLVAGASGTGKTMFAMEFLLRGIRDFGEPGVLFTFEESSSDLIENMASFGFDLESLIAGGMLIIDAFHVEAAAIVATGSFDLEGLFLVVLHGVDNLAQAMAVAEKIRLAFVPPVSLPDGGDPITITMSIGVTVAQPEDSVTTLINRADQALYQAKSEGRNRVVPIAPPDPEGR